MIIQRHLMAAKNMTMLLDNRFKIFGFRFGLDPILGLFPGIGDAISFLLSMYIVWIALKVHVPHKHVAKMVRNVIFDFVIGAIPVVGDVSDFVYKANLKNYQILEKYAASDVIEGEIVDDEK